MVIVRQTWPKSIPPKDLEIWKKNWKKAAQTVEPYWDKKLRELGSKRVNRELAEMLGLPVAFIDGYQNRFAGVIEAVQLTSFGCDERRIWAARFFIALHDGDTCAGETLSATLFQALDDFNPQVHDCTAQDLLDSTPKSYLRRRVMGPQFTARLVAEELER